MAIRIVTLAEADRTVERCAHFREACEVLRGLAKRDYLCDNTNAEIPEGTMCAAVVVLPSTSHHNWEHQVSMLPRYVTPIPEGDMVREGQEPGPVTVTE